MPDENGGERFVWFLAGMAVGAGLGSLFAPKSGRETRQYLGQKAGEGREYLTETGREMYSKGRELYERGKGVVEEAGELVDRGRKAVERATSRA
jgi:gas vesicle protein